MVFFTYIYFIKYTKQATTHTSMMVPLNNLQVDQVYTDALSHSVSLIAARCASVIVIVQIQCLGSERNGFRVQIADTYYSCTRTGEELEISVPILIGRLTGSIICPFYRDICTVSALRSYCFCCYYCCCCCSLSCYLYLYF